MSTDIYRRLLDLLPAQPLLVGEIAGIYPDGTAQVTLLGGAEEVRALNPAKHGGPWPGCYKVPVVPKDKLHMTGKPVQLMRELVSIVPPGGHVLDPFMGSASTGVACIETGRQFVGIEVTQHYYDVSARRLAEAVDKHKHP